jgi:heme-degrading monooxygenase HmoA
VTSDPRAALLAAETALYRAKESGRDRVALAGGPGRPTETAEVYVSMSRVAGPGSRAPELMAAVRDRSRSAERADGFIDLRVWQSDRDAGDVVVVSRWRDRAAFASYMRSPELRMWDVGLDPEPTQEVRLEHLDHLHSYRVVAE